MPLTPGTRLGPYEILAPLGAGGMGEVYRAHDSRLRRDVAIKVSPEHFSERFEKEARAIAALNHSNICTLHDVGPNYLVMELVEGETLAVRIRQGAIPLDEALAIAGQIADALATAHEKGITHRDLKPGNIIIKPDGGVKVLDFGLAKLGGTPTASSDNSPTLTIGATQAGVILGTAAYMAPEQARGKEVDRRADIWAFGVVLYEMLTGQRLFKGDDLTETLASVIKEQPTLERVPAQVERLLRSCLQKDPKQRLQAIGDWRLLLSEPAPVTTASQSAQPQRWIWPSVAAVVTLALAALAFVHFRERPTVDQPLVRLDVDLGADVTLGPASQPTNAIGSSIAISPDGMRLVYISGTPAKLLTRRLDQSKAVELAGTEGAVAPFFSPDGLWIGFQADGKVKKVSVEGGAVVLLSDVGNIIGASWNEDGTLFLGSRQGLVRIRPAGGQPETILAAANGELVAFPQILPGGKAVLFSAYAAGSDASSIEVMTLTDGHRKMVARAGASPQYLATSNGAGYLVSLNKATLFAVPFDVARLETRGTAVPIVDDVAFQGLLGTGQLAISQNGTLLYRKIGPNVSGEARLTLNWLEASGQPQVLPAVEPASYLRLRLSPDGKRLAQVILAANQPSLWIRDLQTDRTSRLTFKGNADTPAWTPNGGHIAYYLSAAGTKDGVYWTRADGAGEPVLLLEKSGAHPDAFSPDGKWLVFHQHESGSTSMWRLPVDATDPEHPKAGTPQAFLQESSNQEYAAFSPDGRWIAYKARDAGREDVYVRPYPGPGGKWLVSSAGGGTGPVWSRTGHELFYLGNDGRVQVAGYTVQGDSFAVGKPRPWSPARLSVTASQFDMMPDGKRMLVALGDAAGEGDRSNTHVTMLLNFFDELRRRAPAGK